MERENILSLLNEIQFTDCQRTVFLVYGLYRPAQTVKLLHPTLAMERENILSPLNEMQFTDCQRTDHHYYSLSDRIDLTDCIRASILDMSDALTCL